MKFNHAVVILLIVLLSGCVTKEEQNIEKISISLDGFNEGDMIPDKFTCEGKDVSPPISWTGIPAFTKSIALIMDDPDAPGGTFVHWVLYNLPSDTLKLPESIPLNKTLTDGSMQGMTDFGRPGYGGPCPPPGKQHRYYFKVYALDEKLDLQPPASKRQVESAMKGHILAQGELMGKYQR